MTDEEIVRRVRAGDTEAYTFLVQRYRKALCSLAFWHLRNRDDAQDAAQQAFVHAFQHLAQLDTPAKFGPWLRRILLNQCRMQQRQRRPISVEEVRFAECRPMERVETQLAVAQALDCLSEANRLTLTLFYQHRFSLEEIAAQLSVPITTVKSRLRNARARLRQELWEMAEQTLTSDSLPDDWVQQVMEMLHGGGILSVAFSRDGKRLLSGSTDKTVKLWDARSGALLRTLSGHTRAVDEVVFAPNGALIASAGRDRTVRLWDAATGELKAAITDYGRPSSLTFAPRGKVFAHVSAWFGPDYRIVLSRAVLRDAQTGQLLRELELMPWHSPDAPSAETPAPLHGMIYGITFSPDGKLLATCNSVAEGERIVGGQIKLWEARTGERLRTLTVSEPAMVKALAFSPDGAMLAGACSQFAAEANEGEVAPRPATSYVQLWSVPDGEPGPVLAQEDSSVVQQIAFSPDGKTLAVYSLRSGENEVRLFDRQTGSLLRTFTQPGKHQSFLAFSPDGRTLAGGAGENLVLWKLK